MAMKNILESRMQDTLMVGVLVLSFAWLIGISAVAPMYADILGPVGYFIIVFGGLFGVEIAVREHVNSFPYLRALVRPDNEWLHLFLKPPGATKRIAPGQYATTLDLRFPIEYDGQTISRIELHHEGTWSERIKFRRGYCSWSGFSVPHPQTEIVEISKMPKSHIMIDRGETVPIFILRSASLDHYRVGEVKVDSLKTMDDVKARLAAVNSQLAESERRKSEWHQRAVAAEEVIEQQKSEIRGLMSAKSGLRELSYEYMLTIYQACGSIEKALAHLKGSTLTDKMLKYAMITIISVAALGWMWYNPDAVTTLASNSLFLVAVLAVAIVGGIIFIYTRGWKSGIP